MSIPKIVLLVLSILSIVAVTVPLIRKDFWVYRIFDYPRLQKIVLIGVLIALWLSFYNQSDFWLDMLVMGSLVVSFIFLGFQIIPFTPLGKKMIHAATVGEGTKTLDVLVSNVYQYNTNYQQLLSLVKSRDPDIIFLLETDQKWQDAVDKLEKEYPFTIKIPMENTYGLLFYSRLPIVSQHVNYLIDDEIPSVIVDVEFSGKVVRIYGLHPAPPVPQESTHSSGRDAEILLVGKLAKKHNGPCMVIGDLNDVAWSYTTELFLKISGLLDPRHGRGLYSTFHAKYRLLRWPLDHFFVSDDFHLVDMKVEKFIGSDHFPISISLVFAKQDDANPEQSDAEDRALASEKIEAGKNDDPR